MGQQTWIAGSERVRVRRVGPVGRVLIALAAIGLIALGVLVAIPLLIVGAVFVFVLLIVARIRLALARRERDAGRENVRVIHRDP